MQTASYGILIDNCHVVYKATLIGCNGNIRKLVSAYITNVVFLLVGALCKHLFTNVAEVIVICVLADGKYL